MYSKKHLLMIILPAEMFLIRIIPCMCVCVCVNDLTINKCPPILSSLMSD